MFCRLPSKRKRKSDLDLDIVDIDPFNHTNYETLAAIGSDMASLLNQTPAFQVPINDNSLADSRYFIKSLFNPRKTGVCEYLERQGGHIIVTLKYAGQVQSLGENLKIR